jgi:hypothetical protein
VLPGLSATQSPPPAAVNGALGSYLNQQSRSESALLLAQRAMVRQWLLKVQAADEAAIRSAAAAEKASAAYALSTAQVRATLAVAHKAITEAESAAEAADSATAHLHSRLTSTELPAVRPAAADPGGAALVASNEASLVVVAKLRESQDATAAAHALRLKNMELQRAAQLAASAARDSALARSNLRATALHTVDRAVALAAQRLQEAAALAQKSARDLSSQLRIADKGASDAARAEELHRSPEEVSAALHSSLAQANAARALHELANAEAHHALFARRVFDSLSSAAEELHRRLDDRPAASGISPGPSLDTRSRWDTLAGKKVYGVVLISPLPPPPPPHSHKCTR